VNNHCLSLIVDTIGRFFRKLIQNKAMNKIYGTKTVIGKNLLNAFPSRIAPMIGLDQPSLYTGHCSRRTTATLAASKGMTWQWFKLSKLPDTVVQKYIDSSEFTKTNASMALSIGDNQHGDGVNKRQKVAYYQHPVVVGSTSLLLLSSRLHKVTTNHHLLLLVEAPMLLSNNNCNSSKI